MSIAGCIECGCHERGSSSQSCNDNTGQCSCQSNATGLQCNSCPTGYYETTGIDQEFCLSCFCFTHNQGTGCQADSNNYILGSELSDFSQLECFGNAANCSDGWILYDNEVLDTLK